MRRLSGFALLLPLFLGCAGKNIVAGEEKTKSQQLEAALPSWCSVTCARLRACPQSDCECSGDVCDCGGGVDQNCEAQCTKSFTPFLNAGDQCAAIGERIKSCVDGLRCSQLTGQDYPCAPTDADAAACPGLTGGDSSAPTTSVGPSAGPIVSVGYAGSASGFAGSASLGTGGSASTQGTAGTGATASIGGAASIGGGSTIGGTTSIGGTAIIGGESSAGGEASTLTVHCNGSYAAGGGAPDNGTSKVTCEEGRDECDDGHGYSWLCAQDSQGRRACSCLVDAQVRGGFEPTADCPSLPEVNVGCGWALAE